MFYSKYSDYAPDQIFSPRYTATCEHLLSLIEDENVRRKAEQLLNEGGFEDFSVNVDDIQMKNNPNIDRKKRLGMAYLLGSNPQTFEKMVQENVNMFHGTNASILPSILKYGINSVDKQTQQGIENTTGEEWSRFQGKRDFISFTDDLDLALGYASVQPNKDVESINNFGMLIGLSSKDIVEKLRYSPVKSDMPEIGITETISTELIKMICVPASKVAYVEKMVNGTGITVMPMIIKDHFFDIQENSINSLSFEEPTLKTIYSDQVADLTKGRRKSNIFDFLRNLKSKMRDHNRGVNYERNDRD